MSGQSTAAQPGIAEARSNCDLAARADEIRPCRTIGTSLRAHNAARRAMRKRSRRCRSTRDARAGLRAISASDALAQTPATSFSAQDVCIPRRLQKSAGARTAMPSGRATAAGAPPAKQQRASRNVVLDQSHRRGARQAALAARLDGRSPRSHGQRARRRTAAPVDKHRRDTGRRRY